MIDEQPTPKRLRFDDVILEHAKEALVQLGYKRRVAREALLEVTAHVGAHVDAATLVRAVLSRAATEHDSIDGDKPHLQNKRS